MNAMHRIIVLLTLACDLGAAGAQAQDNPRRPVGNDVGSVPQIIKGPRLTAADYEARAAAHPLAAAALGLPGRSAYVLFSQCRLLVPPTYAPLAAGEHDAIVDDTTLELGSPIPGTANTCFNPQNEQNIVVNPGDPNQVVTSANEYRADVAAVYVSHDRGASWRNIVLPGWSTSSGGTGQFANYEFVSDPVLAYSRDGTRLYYSSIVYRLTGPGLYQLRSGVAIASSTDGGLTWSAPTMVHSTASGNFFQDKQWHAVGPDGAVHVTWTQFQSTANGKFGASPIYIASSRDGGRSFDGAREVSDATHWGNQGSSVEVAADGTIFVSYISFSPETGYLSSAVVLARSADGGKRWVNAQGPRIYDDDNCYPTQLPGTGQGRQTLSAQNYRIHSFPSMALDASTGRVHLTWTDNREHGSCGYEKGGAFNPALGNTVNRTWYSRTDDGVQFSAPVALTAPADDTIYPAIAARDGKVVLGYYTRRYAKAAGGFGVDGRCSVRVAAVNEAGMPDGTLATLTFGSGTHLQTNVCIDYAARLSTDGGTSFGFEQRLSSESSNPWVQFTGSFIGDYTGVALDVLNRLLAVWTDFRGNPGTGAGRVTPPNQDAVVRLLP